jgi:uncharacterized protein with beta-barrel porin domain
LSAALIQKERQLYPDHREADSISRRREMKEMTFVQKSALRPRGFTAVMIAASIALAINHKASAQTILAPPITFFEGFAATPNQAQVAISLDRILDQEIATGQTTLVTSPTGTVLTAPTGSLPLFVLIQLAQELGPNFLNPAFFDPAIQRAFVDLAPNLYTDLPYITFNNTHTVYDSLESRMAEIRSDYIQVTATTTPTYTSDGKSGAGKEIKNPFVPPPAAPQQKWGFFAIGNGKFGEVDSDGNGTGFKYQSGGVVVGADYKIFPELAAGFAGAV